MEFEQITYEVSGPAAIITLNRPDKLNAFTARMVSEMVGAFDLADADGDVRGVIVTGAGRAFCAGADMSGGSSTFEKTSGAGVADIPEDWRGRDGGGILTLRIFNSLKPVIGAVNGAAAGVGSTMLLPMDIRLASADARFGFVFTQRGIVPEAASSWFLPRVVGISRALEWSFSGRMFGADEALAGGLIRSIHQPDELLPAAQSIVAQWAESTSSVSVAMARQMLWRMLGESHPMAAHRVESRAVPELGAMADVVEGVDSFLEKRPPNFTLDPAHDMPPVYPWFTEPSFQDTEPNNKE